MGYITLNKYKDLLLESRKSNYTSGCLMVEFDFDLKQFHKLIDKEDLADMDDPLETETHVTILYGLDKDIDPDEFKDDIPKAKEIDIVLKKVSLFKNDKFDVLKFTVDSKDCDEVNKYMCDNFEYKNDYPKYEPHMTIAYLKPGTGSKYMTLINKTFDEKSLTGDRYIYTSPKSNKVYLK